MADTSADGGVMSTPIRVLTLRLNSVLSIHMSTVLVKPMVLLSTASLRMTLSMRLGGTMLQKAGSLRSDLKVLILTNWILF